MLIDVLSKYAVVVPIKSKDGPDVIAGTVFSGFSMFQRGYAR